MTFPTTFARILAHAMNMKAKFNLLGGDIQIGKKTFRNCMLIYFLKALEI